MMYWNKIPFNLWMPILAVAAMVLMVWGDERPNILFIMSDDHAAAAISCYGSRINQTPHIDRLAREGIKFENCFCTNSICAPSRAVILSGRHSHLNGVINNRVKFDGSQMTFPKLLRQAGYTTAMIGKWHLKSDPTGFDYWNVLPGQGAYYNPVLIDNGEQKKLQGYVTDILTDLALDWLKGGRDKSKPFCLMFHHKAPHRNWQPGPNYLDKYDNVTIPEPPTLFDDYAGRGHAAAEQDMMIKKTLNPNDLKLTPPRGLNPDQLKLWKAEYDPKNEAFKKSNLKGQALIKWKYQRYIKDYLRCIASVDDNIGRVLDYLEQAGLANNTLVVYTSDQGFYLGDHGWFDKRFMYEESLRMPLLMRLPGIIPKGSSCKALVQNLDFAPTFLQLAGIAAPKEMQGMAMQPLFKGDDSTWRKAIYYHYFEYPAVHQVKRHYGIRTERYKLIHFYYDIDEWELYDLKKDPAELFNIYQDSTNQELIKLLKSQLSYLRKKYGDTDAVTQSFLPKKAAQTQRDI